MNLCSGTINKLCASINDKGSHILHTTPFRIKYNIDKATIARCQININGENILSLVEVRYALLHGTKLEK